MCDFNLAPMIELHDAAMPILNFDAEIRRVGWTAVPCVYCAVSTLLRGAAQYQQAGG